MKFVFPASTMLTYARSLIKEQNILWSVRGADIRGTLLRGDEKKLDF